LWRLTTSRRDLLNLDLFGNQERIIDVDPEILNRTLETILDPTGGGNLGGYANPVPDGYIVLRPATFGGYALLRSNLNHGEADVARPPEQLRSSVMTESPESILRRLSDDCTQLEMAVAMEGREPPQWLFVEDIFILNQRLSRLFGTILEAQLEHLTSTRLGGRSS
jgi:hypothetical protein